MKTIIQKIIKQLNDYTLAYEKGKPLISDKEWDDLYFKLKALEDENQIFLSDSPTQKIIFQTVSNLEKIEHNHDMLSLDKTKDLFKVKDFLGEKDCIAMCKMDGLTCSLMYENGKLVKAETRGDGKIGENIFHNALVIPSIPNKINYKNNLIIDGEIICKYDDFKNFKTEYKNPRNFASGSIRLLDSKECSKRNLTFVAWDIIEGFEEKAICDSLHHCFNELNNLGFITVPYTICSNILEEDVEIVKNMANEYNYPIDGVVFKYNNREYKKTLGQTDHHFKNALAYKFYDEEYETTLLDIEWSLGRTGILSPVAIFDSVEIDGSIVERASLSNITIMKETLENPYIGQKIWVSKRNMIIPKIERAEKNKKNILEKNYLHIPEECPICGGKVFIHKENNSEMLYCEDPQCEGKIINRLDHFCGKKGLDIKGLSTATLEKLISWGWIETIEDIFYLSKYQKDWEKKEGFGEKSVLNIINAIDKAKNCSLDSFICAIGIPLIGKTVSKTLSTTFESWEKLMEAVEDENYSFTTLPNFGYELNKNLKRFDYQEANKIYSLLNIKQEKKENNILSLKDYNIVITGKLTSFKNRNELKDYIEKRGGKVTSSISSKTSFLINNNIDSKSSKNIKAKELDIPILTENDFIKNF